MKTEHIIIAAIFAILAYGGLTLLEQNAKAYNAKADCEMGLVEPSACPK